MKTAIEETLKKATAAKNAEEFMVIYKGAFLLNSVLLITKLIPIGLENGAFDRQNLPSIPDTISLAEKNPKFVSELMGEFIFPTSMRKLLGWAVGNNNVIIFEACLELLALRAEHDEYQDMTLDFITPLIKASDNSEIKEIWSTFKSNHADDGFFEEEPEDD